MKLNHRDRVLITIVFVAAVWLIGVWIFIIPAFQELGEKRDELNGRQVILSEKKSQIEQDKDLPQRIEEEYERSVELSKFFYTRETTQSATDLVDQLLDEQKIVNSTMEITEYSKKTIKPFYYVSKIKSTDFDTKAEEYENIGASSSKADTSSKAQAKSAKTKDGAQFTVDPNLGVSIGFHEITLEFRGVYKDVQKFCDKLKEGNKERRSMVLSGLSIKDVNGVKEEGKEGEDSSSSQPAPEKKDDKKEEEGVEANEVEGTITINLMVIQKLTKPEF